MKIYTGGGDKGKTSLFSGERVDKSHHRIEAYGELDELSAHLGLVASFLEYLGPEVEKQIQTIQGHLFVIGSHLATTSSDSATVSHLPVLGKDPAEFLENAMDQMTESLPRLTGFVLPGPTKGAALAHVARCVCRRAERRLAALAAAEEPAELGEEFPNLMVYINRLSDYLFVLARTINLLSDQEDILWKP